MAYRVLLVPVLGDPADRGALDLALSIGQRLQAHVVGAHVREPIAALMTGNIYDPMPLPGSVIARIEEEARQQGDTARGLFRAWMADNAIEEKAWPEHERRATAEWIEEEGSVSAGLAFLARSSDLVVLPRTPRAYAPASDEALHGALFDSGRPVMIVPGKPDADPFDTVMIAWNDSREAAHAVAAAWSLIGRARRIVVFVGGTDERLRRSADRFVKHLGWRGYPTPAIVTEGPQETGPALLAAARREAAGLIVMGAYTHSRLRQLAFGGVTSHILAGATMPVLMAH